MISLDATTKSLEIVLGGTVSANQLPVVATYVDVTSTDYTPISNDTQSNGTSTVTIVAAPDASTQRQVKFISIYNADTASATVTVRLNNNSTLRTITKAVLPTGYTLVYTDGEGWRTLTTNGGVLQNTSSVTAVNRPFLQWTALANNPPASAFATLDTRNSHPVLDFDGVTDEEAVFGGVLPVSYAGGGITIEIWVAFTSATSGSAHFQAAIERIDVSSLDIDADSFSAFNESSAITAPGTSGQAIKTTVTFTDGADMDSLAAGEAFRLKIRRDADGTGGTDDITTDAEVLRVVLRETA
jgi:hypothetical protein